MKEKGGEERSWGKRTKKGLRVMYRAWMPRRLHILDMDDRGINGSVTVAITRVEDVEALWSISLSCIHQGALTESPMAGPMQRGSTSLLANDVSD